MGSCPAGIKSKIDRKAKLRRTPQTKMSGSADCFAAGGCGILCGMETSSPALVTASQVEAFFAAKILEVQAVVPEYASVGLELTRHIHCVPSESVLVWKLYTESTGHKDFTTFDGLMHQVSKHSEVRVAKLREQAAALLKQAEEIEATVKPTPVPAGQS